MNLRTTILSFGLMALVGAISASSACESADACEKAIDRSFAKLDSCTEDNTTGETGETGEGTKTECTEALQTQLECLADCDEDASCEAINGTDTAAQMEWTNCRSECTK